jgi:hypothetical protein
MASPKRAICSTTSHPGASPGCATCGPDRPRCACTGGGFAIERAQSRSRADSTMPIAPSPRFSGPADHVGLLPIATNSGKRAASEGAGDAAGGLALRIRIAQHFSNRFNWLQSQPRHAHSISTAPGRKLCCGFGIKMLLESEIGGKPPDPKDPAPTEEEYA